MFYNAKPDIFIKAKALRENMTQSESLLWEVLRNNNLGVRFKAQHPIDIFIADFYCHKHRLVIEVDGGVHETQKDYDDGRTAEMESYGIRVIRFRNEDVLSNLDGVIEQIKLKIASCSLP